MLVKPIEQTRYDNRDLSLTIGNKPDSKVRRGDVIEVKWGTKYPAGTLLVVKYAVYLPADTKYGTTKNTLFICCMGGEFVRASHCIVRAVSRSEDTPFNPNYKPKKRNKPAR